MCPDHTPPRRRCRRSVVATPLLLQQPRDSLQHNSYRARTCTPRSPSVEAHTAPLGLFQLLSRTARISPVLSFSLPPHLCVCVCVCVCARALSTSDRSRESEIEATTTTTTAIMTTSTSSQRQRASTALGSMRMSYVLLVVVVAALATTVLADMKPQVGPPPPPPPTSAMVCVSDNDCQDQNSCTTDVCIGGLCQHLFAGGQFCCQTAQDCPEAKCRQRGCNPNTLRCAYKYDPTCGPPVASSGSPTTADLVGAIIGICILGLLVIAFILVVLLLIVRGIIRKIRE